MLVVPPMALSKKTMALYQDKFTTVHCQTTLKTSALALGTNDLVICGKLNEAVVEAHKEFKLTLWVYKLQPNS